MIVKKIQESYKYLLLINRLVKQFCFLKDFNSEFSNIEI